ncbi:CRISPR-associated protein [Marinomonas spartinae]|uniref:type III-B CRISPR-associated protein Cas10/Cmr2 n=1 Tax=Marinomonas spartinae TaxID=1792290 RepID=UPI000808A949|nr:type III-B CRISPR-associated protein Cas10/Cmr2 [Marinomonas spartinae]SBS35750.1 CRISPR-associated protein [Marinomonas spartinae]
MDYLVAISIGPVQSLIEAGRRSQDLWCGSWLLSEVSRAVAYNLNQSHNDCLIFPSPEHPDIDLQSQDSDSDSAIEANIANVVRAVLKVEDVAQVRAIVDAAKRAAEARLMNILDDVWNKKLNDLNISRPRFEQQKHDILETYAAWVKLEPNKYGDASERLGKLLAARKQTKDFQPIQDTATGLFKSTLDGANNTLTDKIRRNKEQRHQLRLSEREELDILGLIKRKAGQFEQFTPFSRVVTESWLASLSSKQRNDLQSHYQPFVEAGIATTVKGNEDAYQAFPYDGEYLFASRIEQEKDLDKTIKKNLLQYLSGLYKEKGPPVPYGVLLKADGDRMGELLSKAKEKAHSIAISKALHKFANDVRGVVREHGGHAIYTGGDDILAFLPLNTALVCSKELATLFASTMSAVIEQQKLVVVNPPTLSVGLAIGHFVQPMRQLRHRAVQAEKLAKGNGLEKPRNALAIQLGIRSGYEIEWRCRWDDVTTMAALNEFVAGFRKGLLPTRIMQYVLAMAQSLKWTQDKNKVDKETGTDIRLSEMQRMLARASFAHQYSEEQLEQTDPEDKRPENEKLTFKKQVSLLKQQLLEQAQDQSLDELANMLRIARWLSARTTADLGKEDMS